MLNDRILNYNYWDQNLCYSELIFASGRRKESNLAIQINSPTRCNSFTSLLLDVLFRSTCFGRLHAYYQELTTALTASGFTLERGGSSVVGRGLAVKAVVSS